MGRRELCLNTSLLGCLPGWLSALTTAHSSWLGVPACPAPSALALTYR